MGAAALLLPFPGFGSVSAVAWAAGDPTHARARGRTAGYGAVVRSAREHGRTVAQMKATCTPGAGIACGKRTQNVPLRAGQSSAPRSTPALSGSAVPTHAGSGERGEEPNPVAPAGGVFRPRGGVRRTGPLSGFSAKLSEKSGENSFVSEHCPTTIC